MISQLNHLRELRQMQKSANKCMGKILAIASGKGGVGKSHLALNLGVLFSKFDGPTLLMDGDAGMADLHLMLGCSPEGHWGHFIDGSMSFEQIIFSARPHLDLIQGFSGVVRMDWIRNRAAEQILLALQSAVSNYHRVIVDVGAGVSESSLLFSTSVDLVILVLTPEITAIADAYGMLKTIRKNNPDQAVAIVVNQVSDSKQGEKTFSDFAKVSEQFLGFSPTYLGALPLDPQLSKALLSQRPLYEMFPRSAYGQALVELRFRIESHFETFKEKSE